MKTTALSLMISTTVSLFAVTGLAMQDTQAMDQNSYESYGIYDAQETQVYTDIDYSDAVRLHTSNNINYISGGIGTDERAAMEAMKNNFNTQMMFSRTDGAYLSDADVVISDLKNNILVEATADGPWFYAQLPQGTYRITARVGDNVITRKITTKNNDISRVNFNWNITDRADVTLRTQ